MMARIADKVMSGLLWSIIAAAIIILLEMPQ